MGASYYFRLAIDNFDQPDVELKQTIRQAYPLSELAILTSQFPSVTFSLFFCYFGGTILTVYQVRNASLITSSTVNGNDCKLDAISFGFSITNLTIEHELTEYLNQ